MRALHLPTHSEPLKNKAWKHELIHDFDSGDGRGRGRWVNYMTKNISRYDDRIVGQRVFFSHEMKRVAKEMWALVSGDPYTGPATPSAPRSELAETCMLYKHTPVLPPCGATA